MAEASIEAADDGELGADAAGWSSVVRRIAELRKFTKALGSADFESGDWFTKLCMHVLMTYAAKVDAEYLLRRNPGMPANALVDKRIKLAAREGVRNGNGVSGIFGWYVSAAGQRSPNVMANALIRGFQRIVHRARPAPVGSRLRVTRYRHFNAACSVGKCPRARTALR